MNATLVIGIGNTLRGDDGAGIRLVEHLAQDHQDISTLTVHELTPELADTVARFRRVVFVDAGVRSTEVVLAPVVPAAPGSTSPGSHTLDPAGLLRLALSLYDAQPAEAWLLEIPATGFPFSEQLSPATEAAVAAAEQMLHALLQDANR